MIMKVCQRLTWSLGNPDKFISIVDERVAEKRNEGSSLRLETIIKVDWRLVL